MNIEKKKKLSILVVLYNKKVSESKTLLALMKSTVMSEYVDDVVVWDNSSMPLPQQELDKLFYIGTSNISIKYKHSEVNLPLSSVYNIFIDEYKESCSHLCVLDDDSDISDDFFYSWRAMFKKNPEASIYLPNIYHNATLVSPTRRYFLKGTYFKREIIGRYVPNNLSAINSGMIISTDYLIKYLFRYNEQLKSYGTDDFFMVEFQKNKKINPNLHACILDYSFSHDLTLSTLNKDSAELQNRYAMLLDSWQIIYSDSKKIVYLYSFIHSIYMSLKYRNFNYFFIFKGRLF